jgi:AAA domain
MATLANRSELFDGPEGGAAAAPERELEAALACIDRGWAACPIAPSGEPIIENNRLLSTCRPGVARAFWRLYPDARVGVLFDKNKGVQMDPYDLRGAAGVAEFAEVIGPQRDNLLCRASIHTGEFGGGPLDYHRPRHLRVLKYDRDAKAWVPLPPQPPSPVPLELLEAEQSPNGKPSAGLCWELLSQIDTRSIVFLDKPFWQASAFHLVVGRKGVGKGTALADLAARVTRGELGPKRRVVWIASEDSASIDLKPRVLAAGGQAELIAIVTDWLQLPRDIDRLGSTIVEVGGVGLVIIDPVGNHITGKSSNDDTDIRAAIAPLNDLADRHETMLAGVRHLTEKEITAGALGAILGASAWVQVPRAVIAIARDTEDPAVSHMRCIAGNRLPPETLGRSFRITGVALPGLENEVTRAVWLGESDKDIGALLAPASEEPPSRSAEGRELLLDILDLEGKQESDALDARVAAETGLAARTIRNLRLELGREGLIRAIPDTDEDGEILRWLVARSRAPRA